MSTYFCHSGWIISRSDGDEHFVTSRMVAELYGLNQRHDKIVLVDTPYDVMGYTAEVISASVNLYPDSSGEYKLPEISTTPTSPVNGEEPLSNNEEKKQ